VLLPYPLTEFFGPPGLQKEDQKSVGVFPNRSAFFALIEDRLESSFRGPTSGLIFQVVGSFFNRLVPGSGKFRTVRPMFVTGLANYSDDFRGAGYSQSFAQFAKKLFFFFRR